MSGSVFISYRREDSALYAQVLYHRLVERLGRDRIFMDVDTIEPGADFVEAIESAVGSCDVLIVLIGREWLTIADPTGRCRLLNPEDFVRVEIAAALKRGVRLIPVLVRGAAMPSSDDLPDALASFAKRQAVQVSDTHLYPDTDRLVSRLEQLLDTEPKSSIEQRPPTQELAEARSARQDRMKDMLSGSISIETLGGVATTILAKGLQLPAEKAEIFSTAVDNQTRVEIHLVYGENKTAKQNISLGRYYLDVPPAPKGVPQIEVLFRVDTNLKLSVTAKDLGTANTRSVGSFDLSSLEPFPPAD